MMISDKAKERFCKDCKIPISLFREPYFSDRIRLFDKYYGTIAKWNRFVNELERYDCEQDYFEEYNRVKDAAIAGIKESEAYQRFNSEDMNKYAVTHKDLPNNDIFKPGNDGKLFISIDMKKANFSSLSNYDKTMFGGANTWEEFISQFTSNKHIIGSKYIRQVILGNCNPKRHVSYEKWIMDQALSLLNDIIDEKRVVFFSNDEIVYDMTGIDVGYRCVSEETVGDMFVASSLKHSIENILGKNFSVPFRVELFSLYKIHGTAGYCKKIYEENGEYNIDFKCLDSYMMPFVLRYFEREEVAESDKIFYHEGLLAKCIDIPKIEVDLNSVYPEQNNDSITEDEVER